MKKILLYIDKMYHGGAQRVMSNLAEYFCSKGVDVTLVNDFPPNANIEEYFLPEKVKRVFLRKDLNGNKIIKNIKRLAKLRTTIQREKPDVVLSFLGRPNIRMLLATLGLPTKKIVSVRNDPNKEYAPGGAKKWFCRQLFRAADGCVFQTEDASLYFPKAVRTKSKIILNPVGESFYKTKRAKQTRDVITAGRLEPQKNHAFLIDAFSIISHEFPDDKLVIYGEGSLRAELLSQIKQLDLQDIVILAGDTNKMNEKLAKASVFVLSSNFEGLPNALMEAMAIGVPVISTDCPSGGPRTLIQDGKNGFLVECNERIDLANKMRVLLSDEEMRQKFTEAGKASAMSFRAQVIMNNWEEYIWGVCSACKDAK